MPPESVAGSTRFERTLPKDVVVVLQQDAVETTRMKALGCSSPRIFSGEVELFARSSRERGAGAQNLVPDRAKDGVASARRCGPQKWLESHLARAIRWFTDRRQHSAFRSLPNLDWPRARRRGTQRNHSRMIIPEIQIIPTSPVLRNEMNNDY